MLEGLPLVGATGGSVEWVGLLRLDVQAVVELCCLGRKEEGEAALKVLLGEVGESLLVSVLELKKSLTDFLRSALLKRS